MNYLGEFGGNGKGPGQFSGVHAIAVGPNGLIFALDRSGGRINVFRTTPDPKKVEYVDAFPGFSLPLDIIVNDDSIWITDLKPLRFVKLDFKGNAALHLDGAARSAGWLPRGAHVLGGFRRATCMAGTISTAARRSSCRRRAADPTLLIRAPWKANGSEANQANRPRANGRNRPDPPIGL